MERRTAVQLPRLDCAAARVRPRGPARSRSRRQPRSRRRAPCILVIDDEAASLAVVETLLRSEGFTVQTATDAISPLKVLRKVQPDLILMDIQLPGVDGWELTAAPEESALDAARSGRGAHSVRSAGECGARPGGRLRRVRPEAGQHPRPAEDRAPAPWTPVNRDARATRRTT